LAVAAISAAWLYDHTHGAAQWAVLVAAAGIFIACLRAYWDSADVTDEDEAPRKPPQGVIPSVSGIAKPDVGSSSDIAARASLRASLQYLYIRRSIIAHDPHAVYEQLFRQTALIAQHGIRSIARQRVIEDVAYLAKCTPAGAYEFRVTADNDIVIRPVSLPQKSTDIPTRESEQKDQIEEGGWLN